MISKYIRKVKANTGIYATKKSNSVLDGAYLSIFMGRSLNFEDLREYVPGDSIKDVDWKASSRSGSLLVKRYVAEKKHNILIVLDTGKKMRGETITGDDKKEVAMLTAGTISYIAYRNGDNIGALYNNDEMVNYHQFKTGLVNVEKFLSYYDRDIYRGKKNPLEKSLAFILNNLKRRMIVFVITDQEGMSSVSESMLKQLRCKADVLFVNIPDADIVHTKEKKKKVFDLDGDRYMPPFISRDKKLAQLEKEYKEEVRLENDKKLNKCGISSVDIRNEAEVTPKVIELLEKYKNVNIR